MKKKIVIFYSLAFVFLGVFVFQLFAIEEVKGQSSIDFSKAQLTPLMEASSICFTEGVQALIDAKCGDGCDPKFREPVYGLTALILAAQNKDKECKSTIDLLMENGADANASIGKHGELLDIIALTFNVLKGHPNATQSLMVNLDPELIEAHFLYATGLGNEKIVRNL